MNALRSSSAFARRSLTPASISAPLSSSRLLSSSSSQLPSSQRSLSSVTLRSNRLSASSRWSGSSPSVNFFQIRTMASESKIKVVNPVVELDGDEVRNTIGGVGASKKQNEKKEKKKRDFCPSKTSRPLSLYSLNLLLLFVENGPARFTSLTSCGSRCIFALSWTSTRGNTGESIPMCQWLFRGATVLDLLTSPNDSS